jgi:hypothetical protein
MGSLVERFRDPANVAVEVMLHRRDRAAYHLRWPEGHCPLCSRVQNALSASRLQERIRALVQDLM